MKRIIIAVLVVVLGVGFFLYKKPAAFKPGSSKTGSESKSVIPKGWEVYQFEEAGLKFAYPPPDWEFSVISDMNVTVSLEDKSQDKIKVYMEEMYPSYSIQIRVEKNSKGLTAEEYHLDMFGEGTSRDYEKERISDTSYGGKEGIKYLDAAAPSSGPVYGILLADSSYLYRITYGALATQETHEKYSDVFESLLGTLEFSVASPSDKVQTYLYATLGTLEGATIDYALAKTLLSKEMKGRWTDDSFIPLSYGIQQGPDSIRMGKETINGNTAEVVVDPFWGGELGTTWNFQLEMTNDQWLITEIVN
ncbi:hypothetical protein ACFL13_01595 [Patescibacteria group bacterium]